MSGPLQSIPGDLEAFGGPSCLLPGENKREFEIIRSMLIEEIRPKTNMEWLWILDLTELSWEILCYRRLKEKIIQIYRANAIAAILQRVDGAGMPPQNKMLVQAHSKDAAIEWSNDPTAASESKRDSRGVGSTSVLLIRRFSCKQESRLVCSTD